MIIHSGLFPDFLKASTTLSLFVSFLFIPIDEDAAIFALSSFASESRSRSLRSSFTASAPIPALNF
jgi:hypothetical protein